MPEIALLSRAAFLESVRAACGWPTLSDARDLGPVERLRVLAFLDSLVPLDGRMAAEADALHSWDALYELYVACAVHAGWPSDG